MFSKPTFWWSLRHNRKIKTIVLDKVNYRETWAKGLQKVVRWFLDADDNPDSHQNLIIAFWPIYNVPWNFHANSFRGIWIKSTN